MEATRERGVEVTSGLDAAQIADALAAATVAVLPVPGGASFRRGSLLAAAVCGVPIVTTMGPDTPPDLAATLSLARTPDEVAAMVACCLSDEAARAKGAPAKRGSGAKGGMGFIANRYCEILAAAL